MAKVSNLTVYRDAMSFDVDQIGTPVLVRTSFFPNWEVTGATGPYRVGPNMMVVVPTSTHVEMTYGRSSVEWGGWILTFFGIVLALWLARRERWLVEENLVFPGDRNDDHDRIRTDMIAFEAAPSDTPEAVADPVVVDPVVVDPWAVDPWAVGPASPALVSPDQPAGPAPPL